MMYINNPEALVAMETERRRGLGLDVITEPDPTPRGTVDIAANRQRRHNYRLRPASTGYAG